MKILKKLTLISLVMVMLVSLLGMNVIAQYNNNDEYNHSWSIQNVEAEELYYQLLGSRIRSLNVNYYDINKAIIAFEYFVNSNSSEHDNFFVAECFHPFLAVSGNDFYEMGILFRIDNGSSEALIYRDYYTGSLILLETMEASGNEFLLIVNGTRYLFVEDHKGNVTLYSEKGYYLPISITNDYLIEDISPCVIIPLNAGWGNEFFAGTRTNTTVLQGVLLTASLVGSIVSVFVPHIGLTILGIVLSVAGASGFAQVRFWIRFYHSRHNNCSTFIRERQNWYQTNDFRNFQRQVTVTFHSVNPEHAGGLCTTLW